MSEIKYIDIEEFRRVGFGQEANRLFFHPHGLALEYTIVDADGWDEKGDKVKALAKAAKITPAEAKKVLDALHPPGTQFISGVWDYRDDPEGVVFGDWDEEAKEKAAFVSGERARHREARAALFGIPDPALVNYDPYRDVEPLGWVAPEDL